MTVYVVTDSTSCLPPALAEEYGITVLDIHTSGRILGAPGDVAATEDAAGAAGAADTGDARDARDAQNAEDAGDAGDAGDAKASKAVGDAGDVENGRDTGVAESTGETLGAEGPRTAVGMGAADGAEDGESPVGDQEATTAGPETSDTEEPTTAGLGPLELTAAYARLLERGGDDGVVAIHLSRELSLTWSSANQAAAVFDGLVEVLDTRTAGMALGQAAIAAAQCAATGGGLAECAAAARRVLDDAEVWLYVHRLDALARGGRLSTAQRLLSTALAIKPILHLNGGKIELAAKTRTQSKAMNRLVGMVEAAYRRAATPTSEDVVEAGATVGGGGGDGVGGDPTASPVAPGRVEKREKQAVRGSSAATSDIPEDGASTPVEAEVRSGITDGVSEGAGHEVSGGADGGTSTRHEAENTGKNPVKNQVESERPRVFTFSGDHEFRLRRRREEPVTLADLSPVAMHLDIHQAGCLDAAEELRDSLREALPECVVISVVDLSPALLVHTGPQAIGVSFVRG